MCGAGQRELRSHGQGNTVYTSSSRHRVAVEVHEGAALALGTHGKSQGARHQGKWGPEGGDSPER